MKLREIKRTATFAWSPGQNEPLIATGSVSGAMDASFSSASELEIFQLNLQDKDENVAVQVAGSVASNAKFNRLAWGNVTMERPYGVIAGGMESGELDLWNPAAIIENGPDPLLMRNMTHTGPVRGLDFNSFQSNLLASAAGNGEIFVWDLTNPTKPYSPGNRSIKMDEITSVSWNHQVQHILATSSTTGYTVVWDLRSRREVMHLQYPGAVGGAGLGSGSRRGITAVAWNPDIATQLVTASEDDSNPVITMWDLRNAHSPEKNLTGHTKGILSLSWCQKDSDLLLSAGKDCRTLCWNPRTGEIIGELPVNKNWAFDVEWCPRNPDLLASASFDSTISIHSLSQGSQTDSNAAFGLEQVASTNNDPFAQPYSNQLSTSSLTLKQPPKWLRPPVGATFSFGGKLVSFTNKSLAAMQAATSNTTTGAPVIPQQVTSFTISIYTVSTEPDLIQRSIELEDALTSQDVQKYIDSRTERVARSPTEQQSWGVLRTLFEENAREKLMKHLGFEKEEVVAQITAAIRDMGLGRKTSMTIGSPLTNVSSTTIIGSPKALDGGLGIIDSGISDLPKSGLSGLFGTTEYVNKDFFGTSPVQTSEQIVDAFPIGSPSSPLVARSDSNIKMQTSTPFKIYPKDESNVDRLITRSIVMGDFGSAVDLCLRDERLSDALLLAICGGPELLARTQKAYFERQVPRTPYLRLLQSIVNSDLSDVVNNASLDEWTEMVVVLCTFAKAEEFANLCEVLGARLEAQWHRLSGLSASFEDKKAAAAHRRNATLCYLAAGNLEKVIGVWITELNEEVSSSNKDITSQYSYHADALQTFIEKVAIFSKAIDFVDSDLSASDGNGPKQGYKLAALYDKYLEYADLMVSQGRLSFALKYLNLTPPSYHKINAINEDELAVMKDRVFRSSMNVNNGKVPDFPFKMFTIEAEGQPSTDATNLYTATAYREQTLLQQTYEPEKQPAYDYNPYNYNQNTTYQTTTQATYPSYQTQTSYPTPAPQPAQQQYQPTTPYNPYQTTYQGQQPYGTTTSNYPYATNQFNPYEQTATSAIPGMPMPPPPGGNSNIVPASQRKDIGNWNDAPPLKSPNVANVAKVPAQEPINRVTSPFPNQLPQNQYGNQSLPQPSALPPANAIPPPPLYRQPGNQPTNQPTAYAPPPFVPKTEPTPPPVNQAYNFGQQTQYQQPYQRTASPAQVPSIPGPFTVAPTTQQTAPLQEQAQAPKVPPAPAVPEKKKHPAGDRTHIPTAHRIIYTVLSNEMQRARQSILPNQKKVLEDTEKRINTLFDILNNEELSPSVANQMILMAQALEHRDYNKAHTIHVELVTTKYEECGSWLVGVKRLIEIVRPLQ